MCPLCGKGEGGSEHLAILCPVVRRAWEVINKDAGEWWLGWMDHRSTPIEIQRRAIKFCHAVAFLTCALGQVPLSDEDKGLKLVLRQVAGS